MPKRITEASTLTVTESPTPGRVLLQLITPGWGSSGYYSPAVLENAATEQVFPAGTHVFFDHPSESERHDRPERSVRDLAMVLDEDARRDDQGGLVAEAKVIGPYRDLITDDVFMEAVGMSIRASADTTVGEAEGRKGTIVTQLIEGVSVDLVTRAGRGGRILAAVESARADMREATASDTRDALHAAVKAAHGADDTWTWVRDFDPDQGLVYFEIEDDEQIRTYSQPYELADDGAASLTGDPVEVRVTTSYVPVVPDTPTGDTVGEGHQPPVNPAGSTQESKEDTMPQIEESRLAQLEADAGRATTAETERDAATARADALEARLAERDRRDQITTVIESVDGHEALTMLERRGLTADAMQGEQVDEDALRTAVESAVADRAATANSARPFGFGATTSPTDTDTVREAETAAAGAFGRTIKEA